MNTFAEYILDEKDLCSKIEITYYLSKKEKIFFEKSVIFKMEIARLFLKYSKLEVDENMLLTACLLYDCKKETNLRERPKIEEYMQKSAEYLKELGFDKRFCKICKEVSRTDENEEREKESDVLELADQFGGMLLDRPERIGFEPDEALVLLRYRNLKDKYNRFATTFEEFVNFLQDIKIEEENVRPLRKLTHLYNTSEDIKTFIKNVITEFEPQMDLLLEQKYEETKRKMFTEEYKNKIFEADDERNKILNSQKNRSLFTEETTRKIIGNLEKTRSVLNNAEEN